MKRFINVIVFVIFFIPLYTHAESTLDIINKKVKEKLDYIKKYGKKGEFVKEIKLKKVKKKVKIKKYKEIDLGTMIGLNITGGIIEGGIIGLGAGSIGYAQTKNKDITHLINGSIIGSIVGGTLGGILTIFEVNTKKYYASSDFGYNLIIYTLIGSALGGCGGVISYGRTDDSENILEGIGYGSSIGAFIGLTFGLVESLLPVDKRLDAVKIHAFNIEKKELLISYNINFGE